MNRDTRSDEEILSWLQSEYDYPFEGWDFSYVSDTRRLMRGFDFWDYPTIAASAAGRSQTVLEQGTGGGERFGKILEAAAFTGRAYGTEGYAPNVLKARERLSAFNVEVIDVSEDAETVPIEDGTIDLVLNRHSGFLFKEHLRLLRPGGAVVTQQVGGLTNRVIHEVLGAPMEDTSSVTMMEGHRSDAMEAGFEIIVAAESFPVTAYTDVGALVYVLKAVPWQILDFFVDRYAEPLLRLHHTLVNEDRNFDVGFHSMLMVMQKPGGEGLMVPRVFGS
jgi:SAM-dependent methyltransferase